ncbi:hypothetical protein RF11_16112 [Thelohanellus kitauei]|uniref:Fatty acid amide hydrolase n=1 Tax=Thelohanellus kitauei TaxID=669202 RepID=A0A0C2MMX5_THEKT|nr:hypothetical protein RF11_16112 [Thelohanellus kitauei]
MQKGKLPMMTFKLANKNDINLKLILAVGSTVTEAELDNVNRQRNRAMKIMDNIFKEVDIFLLLMYLEYHPLAINIGFDKSSNLPIALQMMSKWWSEDLLLSVAYQIEKMFPLTSTPNDYQRVLEPQTSSG